MSKGFTPLTTSILHRSILDNPISIPDFCWDGWLDPWITHLVSLVNGFSVTPLALFPEHDIWKEWEFSKSSGAGSFWLIILCSIYLFLLANSKVTSSISAWKSHLNIQVHWLQALLSTQWKKILWPNFLTLYNKVAFFLGPNNMFPIFVKDSCACLLLLFPLPCFSML